MSNTDAKRMNLNLIYCKKDWGLMPYVPLKRADGSTAWLGVYFGENVNEKVFKQSNHTIDVLAVIPKSEKPWTGKDGKKRYPKVQILELYHHKPLVKSDTAGELSTQEIDVIWDDEPAETTGNPAID